jgi:hypothetical protein
MTVVPEVRRSTANSAKLVAAVIYSEEIVTGNFPEHIPTWWRSRCHGPKPCTSIRDYIRFNDIVIIEEEELFFKPEHLRHICSNGTHHDGGHHDGGHDGGHEPTCDKHEHHDGHGGHGGHKERSEGNNVRGEEFTAHSPGNIIAGVHNNVRSDGNHGEHGGNQVEGRSGDPGAGRD